MSDLAAFSAMRTIAIDGIAQCFNKNDIALIANQCRDIAAAASGKPEMAVAALAAVKGLDEEKLNVTSSYEAVVLLNEIAAWASHETGIEWLYEQLGVKDDERNYETRIPTWSFQQFQAAMGRYIEDPNAFDGLVPSYNFEEDEYELVKPADFPQPDFDFLPDAEK